MPPLRVKHAPPTRMMSIAEMAAALADARAKNAFQGYLSTHAEWRRFLESPAAADFLGARFQKDPWTVDGFYGEGRCPHGFAVLFLMQGPEAAAAAAAKAAAASGIMTFEEAKEAVPIAVKALREAGVEVPEGKRGYVFLMRQPLEVGGLRAPPERDGELGVLRIPWNPEKVWKGEGWEKGSYALLVCKQ